MASWPVPYAVGAKAEAIGIIDALPLGIALLDDEGNCYLTNPVFTETVGLDCASHPGILALAVPEDRGELGRAIADILRWRSGETECRLRLNIRPEETVVLTIARAPPGWGFGAVLAVRDIREQLRLEKQVAQATKMQAVGQLAGGIAHDFNNILTAVLGLCDQLLGRHTAGSEDFDDLDQIRQNAQRAANLTGQLLAFARQQTLRPQIIDVGDVIAGVEPLLRRLSGPDVQLVVGDRDGVGVVRADPGQLEQVLTNLAVNARDAMDGHGRLTITTKRVEARDVAALGHPIMPALDFVALHVHDTGSGIAPEIAGKIFEPFFTTKAPGMGTGLGLSTVYGIVKQTGGFIFASAVDGGGTCFAIYLPAIATEDLPPPVAAVAAPPPLEGMVLLVEDDRAVRLVVERALRRNGLGVITASDGAMALEVLGDAVIDILVSDVVMPGIDGVELLDEIRKQRPGLPVVLMSGYAEPPQRRALDRTGAVFLPKPFAAADLLAAVRAALAAPSLDTSRPTGIDAARVLEESHPAS